MVPSLTDCYHRLGFQVTESEDGLRIGFKPGMAHAIVKEIWNEQPLTRSDVERFYEKLSSLNKGYRNLYFRIVAHGGFLPEALDFELHGLTVSDESYIESLLSGRHVELYPHNEAAYRAIMRGFKQHRIGTVVQATGTGKSYLLARYISFRGGNLGKCLAGSDRKQSLCLCPGNIGNANPSGRNDRYGGSLFRRKFVL